MPRVTTLLLVAVTLAPTLAHARSPIPANSHSAGPVAAPTIAVADFSGPDRETGQFIADTLLTDLARSRTLRLLERTEIRQALNELKLQSSGRVEPGHLQHVGRLAGANMLIVGGYMVRDDRMFINARVLDVRTGRLVPGGAAHEAGDPRDVPSLTSSLARQLHRRLTGTDLLVEGEQGGSFPPPARDGPPAGEPPEANAAPPQNSLLPAGARPSDVLQERDLIGLIGRMKPHFPEREGPAVTPTKPSAPVTRIRVLTALGKLALSQDAVRNSGVSPPAEMPPDAARVPSWGFPYAAAVVAQGWWPVDRELRPREPATWAFVSAVLERMPLADTDSGPARKEQGTGRGEGPDDNSDAATGLVIDARDLDIQRSMSPRILDEDGQVVYPDPGHLPGDDYLQDRGMASYHTSLPEARRAGSHPLIVHAIDVAGPGRDDLVVSRDTAARIRAANRRDHFLWRWAVCILQGAGASARAGASP